VLDCRKNPIADNIKLKAGSLVANLGLGSMLIPTPMDYNVSLI
jgi:hypothetical protein